MLIENRILRHKWLPERLRDWPKLSLLARSKDVLIKCAPFDRSNQGRTGSHRDYAELVMWIISPANTVADSITAEEMASPS